MLTKYIVGLLVLLAAVVITILPSRQQRSRALHAPESRVGARDADPPSVLVPSSIGTSIEVEPLGEESGTSRKEIGPSLLQPDVTEVLAELERLQSENEMLRRELHIALLRCEHPESTPFGALLLLPEATELSAGEIDRLQTLLEDWPIRLLPGEPTWLTERFRHHDWKRYAPTINEAIIGYFGPKRLLAELPSERVDELHEWYSDPGEWESLFGQEE